MAQSIRRHKHQKRTSGNRREQNGGITRRQRDILDLVAVGHTNREMASQLSISVRTVEVHRFNLMQRLHARNVAQLLRQALSHKLLSKTFASR